MERLLRDWLEEPTAGPLYVETSGSTGTPKAVMLSREALRASAAATFARLGGGGQWVLALPVQHVAGMQAVCRSVLTGTSPVVLGDHADLAGATAALTGGRRYLAAVPTQLHRWLTSAEDVDALRRYDAVLIGGASASEALLDEARRQGLAVVATYGMTETCGGCVYDGVALDGVEVSLGPTGDIRISGPMLFDGYVDRPDLTASVLKDGWLHTPDLGRFTSDGRLEVLGRVDDVVVTGGVNVRLPVVEQRLATMPGVGECAVVAVPDVEWGARLVAVVAVSPPAAGQGTGPGLTLAAAGTSSPRRCRAPGRHASWSSSTRCRRCRRGRSTAAASGPSSDATDSSGPSR